MEICSSFRCAVTHHTCSAALLRAKCSFHCSVRLCKTGSQQAVCHCNYTYGDLHLENWFDEGRITSMRKRVKLLCKSLAFGCFVLYQQLRSYRNFSGCADMLCLAFEMFWTGYPLLLCCNFSEYCNNVPSALAQRHFPEH